MEAAQAFLDACKRKFLTGISIKNSIPDAQLPRNNLASDFNKCSSIPLALKQGVPVQNVEVPGCRIRRFGHSYERTEFSQRSTCAETAIRKSRSTKVGGSVAARRFLDSG